MKIAQLSPPWIRVPPTGYGGIEWVVYLLTEQLVARGHDVTLFATGDSETSGHLRYAFASGQTAQMGLPTLEAIHVSYALRLAHEFDLIHDHCGFFTVASAHLIDTPVLHTLHGPFTELGKQYYTVFKDDLYVNAISEYQRSRGPELRYLNTVYNAIDVHNYPFSEKKGDHLIMVSRLSADKGTHLAIEVARRLGRRLVLIGKVDPVDRAFYESTVAPMIDGDQVVFLGEIPEEEKRRRLAEAYCFIFPIQWPEPFGLVMAEAMAAGTPVVALRNGSVPEVVADGRVGFVVDTLDEFVKAVERAGDIDPRACRRHVEENFSPQHMAAGYEENYRLVLAGRSAGGSGQPTGAL